MNSRSLGANGRIPRSILDWSLNSIEKWEDNNLFRSPFEFKVFRCNWNDLAAELTELRVDLFRWSKPRKMLAPKGRHAFRNACQLDPVDSLILTSIIKILGAEIEKRRLPRQRVFSARFDSESDSLYGSETGWVDFWKESARLASKGGLAVRSDITNFYSQIRHSEILRRLEACGAPERLVSGLAGFLDVFGAGHRRGLPIGPHPAHLLAELSLTRADLLLESRGLNFVRWVDDYHIFVSTEDEAQIALYELYELLNNEFGLILNTVKTRVDPADEFVREATRMAEEESESGREEALLEAIREVAPDNYGTASLAKAQEVNPDAVSDEAVAEVFGDYLDKVPVDYKKVAWVLRRLTQIGAPGAIPRILDDFERLVPIVGDVARYLASAGANWSSWKTMGERVLAHSELEISKRSEYVEMVLYSLFARCQELDHFGELTSRFDKVGAPAKRKLVLMAKAAGLTDWLHSLRSRAGQFDPWLTRAYVHSLSELSPGPRQECLEVIEAQDRSTDSIVLGDLMSERRDMAAGAEREPVGPAWSAALGQVPKERRALVKELLGGLGEALEQEIYERREGKLLVATWNLRNFGGAAFGFGDRLPESLVYIARVLLSFDLVAIQEVQEERHVEHLLRLLGGDWAPLMSGKAVGVGGNREMSAFLYRKSRVESLGKVDQLTLPKSDLILKKDQFRRPPFLASFEACGWKLLACSAHLYFGKESGEEYDIRVAEIRTLARLLTKRAKKKGATPLLLADLNVVGPGDDTMKALERYDLKLPERFLAPTNVAGDKFFDQIAFGAIHDGPRVKRSGVFKVFEHVFRETDAGSYENEMESSQGWENKSEEGAIELSDFYRNWRTYQISDHYPVWVELG